MKLSKFLTEAEIFKEEVFKKFEPQSVQEILDRTGWRSLEKAMYKFCESGNLDVVKKLVDAGASVEPGVRAYDKWAFNWSPLMRAVVGTKGDSHYELIKFLIDNGADPKRMIQGDSAVTLAMEPPRAGSKILKLLKLFTLPSK